MQTFLQSLKTLLIAIVLFAGVALVSAQVGIWTPPSQPPTDGNTPAPLNVGTLDQVKNAGLSLNKLLVNGQVRINDGTAAVGKVLTSLDNLGTTQWAAVGAGGIVPDLEYVTNVWKVWTLKPSESYKENSPSCIYDSDIASRNYTIPQIVASCSAGKKVVNGGCEFHTYYDQASYPNLCHARSDTQTSFLALYTDRPMSDGSGWVCGSPTQAVHYQGNSSAISYLYSLTATAICQ